MQELFNHIVKGLIQIIYVKIGIHRKEFRFKGSDKDMLFRQINHRVLCMGLLSDYNVQHTQIYTDSQRQFRQSTRIHYWRKHKDFFYHLDRFRIDGFLCISSAKFRECVHCGWTRQECTLHEPYKSEICNLIRIRSSIHSHVFRYTETPVQA